MLKPCRRHELSIHCPLQFGRMLVCYEKKPGESLKDPKASDMIPHQLVSVRLESGPESAESDETGICWGMTWFLNSDFLPGDEQSVSKSPFAEEKMDVNGVCCLR